MNTATLHETTAIATAAAAVAAGQELLLIPLSRLRPSSRNVRKSGGQSIPELAASIARLGLLQNQGLFLTDAALLERLARDKLAGVADQVRSEGWGWVEVVPRATHAELHAFQRARRTRRAPSKAEAKRIAKLEAKQRELQDRLDDDETDLPDDEVQALQEEVDGLGNELGAIEQSMVLYAPEVMALAGAVVSVDHLGGVVVHRGLLRDEQAKALRAQERGDARVMGNEAGDAASQLEKSGISEKLARRLSAHRTAALQAEVARHPHVALVAVVHRLALRVVCKAYGLGEMPINIEATPQDGLETHAPDIAQAPAAVGLHEVREAWAQRLPEDPDALFAELLAFPQQELLSLLAVCVACTVDAVTARESVTPAAALAHAVGLDMHTWWTPTAAGYFEHVSKAKVLEAVQVFAPDHVGRLAKLKKTELAAEAERLAAGTGWLPAMLQEPQDAVVGEAAVEPQHDEEAPAEVEA